MRSKCRAEVGPRIKDFRKEKGLTQERLAEQADMTPQFLSLVESGLKKPSLDSLIKLAEGLNVSPGELFTFKTDKFDQSSKSKSFKAIVGFLETLNEKELLKVKALLKITFKK